MEIALLVFLVYFRTIRYFGRPSGAPLYRSQIYDYCDEISKAHEILEIYSVNIAIIT